MILMMPSRIYRIGKGSFLDTLEKIAKGSNQVIADIVSDFIDHTGQSGTAVGKKTLIALEALKDLPQISKEIIVSSTVATASTLAQIGSGILLGIAESLQSSSFQKITFSSTLCCGKC